MGREFTLLERIARREERGRTRSEASATENLEGLMESVRTNLARLLNSRQGMSEAQQDYGLPSLTDVTVGSGDYVRMLQESIRQTVEKYEPRLRRIRITLQEQESSAEHLVFRVDAVLVGRSGEHRVWYETAVNAAGQFDVSG
jgi:type VI secretion system protein